MQVCQDFFFDLGINPNPQSAFCNHPKKIKSQNLTMSMITASLWVARGAPAAFPQKYDVDERELERISALARLQLDDAKQDLEESKTGSHAPRENKDGDADEDSNMGGVEVAPTATNG